MTSKYIINYKNTISVSMFRYYEIVIIVLKCFFLYFICYSPCLLFKYKQYFVFSVYFIVVSPDTEYYKARYINKCEAPLAVGETVIYWH